MNISEIDLINAFKKCQDGFLRKVHLYLNSYYYNMIYSNDDPHSGDDSLITKIKHIESVWFEHEKSECLNKYNCYRKIDGIDDIKSALHQHPAFNHPLFQYLSEQPTLSNIKHYILNDSILNLEFFDYLAFAIIGVPDGVRAEIISNLWDEAGRGNIEEFHTTKFRKLMSDLGLEYQRDTIIANMSWEGLAGINLFSHLSIHTHHKIKYYGLLTATEMLDPPHYRSLIKSIEKIPVNRTIDKTYYIEHEAIDVIHADGWVHNVVLPELARRPDKINDFWLGFYMRLDSIHRYYDSLLAVFTNKLAA